MGYGAGMPYDENLADRVREQLSDQDGVTEKRMFGGLAFLLHGNMAVGLSGSDELMVRVGPDGTETALAEPHTRLFDMTGRPMGDYPRGECHLTALMFSYQAIALSGSWNEASSLDSGSPRSISTNSRSNSSRLQTVGGPTRGSLK